ARHFGQNSAKVLVIHAESKQLNPSLDQGEIDDALAEDATAARADYFSQWRDDLSTYVPRDLIEHAVDRGVVVRFPDVRHCYTSFVDVSSGLGDSFAAAIVHREGDLVVLELLGRGAGAVRHRDGDLSGGDDAAILWPSRRHGRRLREGLGDPRISAPRHPVQTATHGDGSQRALPRGAAGLQRGPRALVGQPEAGLAVLRARASRHAGRARPRRSPEPGWPPR